MVISLDFELLDDVREYGEGFLYTVQVILISSWLKASDSQRDGEEGDKWRGMREGGDRDAEKGKQSESQTVKRERH